MSIDGPAQLARRAVVAASLLATAGCMPDLAQNSSASPGQQSAETVTEADLVILEQARSTLLGVLDLVGRATSRHRSLADTLRPLAGLHEKHQIVLAEAGPGTTPSRRARAGVPASGADALSLVRRRESMLQAELADLASRTQSGGLARVLASMSAAIAQHLVFLSLTGDRTGQS